MNHKMSQNDHTDAFTRELIDGLFRWSDQKMSEIPKAPDNLSSEIDALFKAAENTELTSPIIDLFVRLKRANEKLNISPDAFGISKDTLMLLAKKHQNMDEHGVSVGGRVNRAIPIVAQANERIVDYLNRKTMEAPSGIELWDSILENAHRIRSILDIPDQAWNSYSGQLQHCIDSVEKLSKIIDLPVHIIEEVGRVTKNYRMRMTPYYASLIRPRQTNDPILLQSVPTGEMVDNIGIEIPPVAADHSPARLIDQFYPRVLTIKATNMCAMYCTHCLRIAHIGKKDRIYSDNAYEEALNYIRHNTRIRDVLITGGDAFVLPNEKIKKILKALDDIDHVTMKRLGTRIPVTTPWRIDTELMEILEESNDKKPVRVVTQINTAQEITPISKNAFKRISKSVSAVLNQAVLLKGINDTSVKMWKLCETIQESYVRPYYVFNCSYRNPQFAHFRVPVEKGRDIVESMYGNISGDAVPRYIATAGGKIPLHRSNVVRHEGTDVILKKPWSDEEVTYPDADPDAYANPNFSFAKNR
ncbi:MAG: KamA family radical SAM protein [Desulfobacterales bacterium]